MKPVGIAVAFAGYTLAYFGWASTRGPGTGLLDLLIPGRVVIVSNPASGTHAPASFLAGLTPAGRRRYQQTQTGGGGVAMVPPARP